MKKAPENKQKVSGPNLAGNYFQIMWRVSGITVGVMAILGGIGYFIDKATGKFPTFMVAGLIIAYPLSQFLVYKVFAKISKKLSHQNKK